ncbi:MAG TPA: DUF3455 domain-containing protein [Kofleriaceae bacterium]|nr:DUF3455 domain-containing protein [Kofleriaceae bacterium]
MQINSLRTSALSVSAALSAALVASLCAACVTEPDAAPGEEAEALGETAQETGYGITSVTPLPSFSSTANIRTASGVLAGASVVAVAKTIAGSQIYRCEQGATTTEWKLRTPLAGLEPSTYVQNVSLNKARFSSLVGAYHYRSDFGALLAPAQLEALGLTLPPVNAPVWDFTFQPSGQAPRREVVAVRLLAQDTTNAANIPLLLLEVRGRSIDPGTPSAIAGATHLLRWNTRGGLAPAASTCTTATLGREVQSPYSADYYFIDATP